MKKNICAILILTLILVACKKDQKFLYESTDNIYLDYYNKDGMLDTASLTYSFSNSPGLASDTVWIPVKISGKRVDHDRKFVLTIVDTATTATSGLHYEPLKAFYIMPADSGKINTPIVIKNIDPKLTEKSVAITFRIVGTEDFNQSLPIISRTKRLVFSNRLEKPSWWIYWQGQLGEYTRVTHQLFLISGGKDLVDMSKPEAYLQIPRTLYYLENVRQLVSDPFTWVERHPEAGYVLTKRSDGTKDHDFYNINSPEIKFYVKYIEQVDRYFFINESGKQIVM